jgi:4-amino-4-deoxy-L-arabinose transferase-like glycosyltransferase
VLVILAGVMALYLFIASRSSLWDGDEPHFAQAAVEMAHSNPPNYLVPTFQGKPRYDKPILIYWLMVAGIKLLGVRELAVRLFSPIGTAVACLGTYLMGRRLLGRSAALWAMLILPTTFMLTMDGTAAVVDAVLLACITAAMLFLLRAAQGRATPANWLWLGLALGLALLTKGPVGLAVPLLAALGLAWFGGPAVRLGLRFWIGLTAATLLGLALFSAWGFWANSATHGDFLRVGIGDHVLNRMLAPKEGHGGNSLWTYILLLPTYALVVICFFLPWTLFLPGALSAVYHGRIGGGTGRALLLGWIVPTFVLMSLVATKLPHYILPIWPALALAVAGTIEAAERHELPPHTLDWLRRGRTFFGLPALLLAALLLVAPSALDARYLQIPAGITGVLVLAMTLGGLYFHHHQRYRASAVVLLTGMLAVQFSIALLLLPAYEHYMLSPPIARAIRAQTAAAVPVTCYDYDQPSLTYYLGRIPTDLPHHDDPTTADAAAVAHWTMLPGPGVLVITRAKYDLLPAGLTADLTLLGSARGINLNRRGEATELLALGRHLPPRPDAARP